MGKTGRQFFHGAFQVIEQTIAVTLEQPVTKLPVGLCCVGSLDRL